MLGSGGNALYYGDNLAVLRESIATESVDLIYLDPPFNSQATYNVLFKAPSGDRSQAQIETFEDTWHWNESAELAFDEVMQGQHSDAAIMLRAMRSALGENDMMAYLAMMAVRLIELHRVLKPTGSLYLHCDPTASHYLKILLDSIFRPINFVNEVVWKRYGAHNDVGQGSKHYGRVQDTILFYSKNEGRKWTQLFMPLDPAYIEGTYRSVEPGTGRRFMTTPLTGPGGAKKGNPVFEWNGHTRAWRYSKQTMQKLHDKGRLYYSKTGYARQKFYLDESKGVPVQTVWNDIPSLSGAHAERLGYPTQKPLALLERIISASTNPSDVVLDPFCGCGTTVHAAQKLGRSWIGIDVTHLAIALIERRLKDAFPGILFDVHGVPKDAPGARDLALRDKYEFQKWITATTGAQPYKGGKKGMDRGIDGYLNFRDADRKPQFAVVSVKGGENITSGMVRDLKGTVEREKAALGLFLTLNEPTREMSREAATAGFYETGGMKFPKLQILSVADIFDGRRPQVPFGFTEGFKKAEREDLSGQGALNIAPDEVIGLGIYGRDRTKPKWRRISYAKTAEMRAHLEAPVPAYGSVQGIIHSLQKEVRRPFFRVRELATDTLVSCYYPMRLYGDVVDALRERTTVLHVAGDTVFDRVSRAMVELRVDRIDKSRMLSSEEFEQFFGSSPDFTGDLNTDDYIDAIRGDD